MGNPERVIRIGEAGAGQLCKVCNQMVIGGALAVVSEAFTLARKAGIDPAKVREALLGGFAASRVLEVHGERILKGNYKPGFRTALYAKDYRNVGGGALRIQLARAGERGHPATGQRDDGQGAGRGGLFRSRHRAVRSGRTERLAGSWQPAAGSDVRRVDGWKTRRYFSPVSHLPHR